MQFARIVPACSLKVDKDHDVAIWSGSRGLDETACKQTVRSTLKDLDSSWTYELHQYLANSGYSVMMFGLEKVEDGLMPLSVASLKGSFGEGMLVGTKISCEDRIQLGVSVLTAFALKISTGSRPEEIKIEDVTKHMRDLGLPV